MIKRYEHDYQHAFFHFIALRRGGVNLLARAVIGLSPQRPRNKQSLFESPSILAGRFLLSDIRHDPRSMTDALVRQSVSTPAGEVVLAAQSDNYHSALYTELDDNGLTQQRRVSTLRIFGQEFQIQDRNSALDWELKSSATPYDSVQDLMAEYSLGLPANGPATLIVIAPNIAEVDRQNSVVTGETAKFGVILPIGLSRNRLRLGYLVRHKGTTVKRSEVPFDQISWKEEGDSQVQIGSTSISVPKAAIVQCIVSYSDLVQHFWWIHDPSASQNPRRSIYESFDPGFEKLQEIAQKLSNKEGNARELESIVARILWTLGFGVLHIGTAPLISDSCDLLAVSTSGNVMVVECTTGGLKADKLDLLAQRTRKVRESLTASGVVAARAVPVVVTLKSRSDVELELEGAKKIGILAVTGDQLQRLIDRTLDVPNSDRIFDEADSLIREGKEKHSTSAQPPTET